MVYQRYSELGIIMQQGTRALGANVGFGGKTGTVSFPTRFPGTPQVLLSIMAGSSSLGRSETLRAVRAVSGSFQWRTTGSAGTVAWSAWMHLDRWPRRTA